MNNDKHPYSFNEPDENEKLFSVPEGYFERLPDQIMSRIKALPGDDALHPAAPAEKHEPVVIRLFAYAASVAAALIISLGISNYFSDGTQSLVNSVNATDIIESEVLYEIDESLLAEQLATEDLELSDLSPSDQTEIGEYLIDQNSDISPLLNEL